MHCAAYIKKEACDMMIRMILSMLLVLGLPGLLWAEPIAVGQPFPDLTLELPSKASAEYLGVPGRKATPVSGIDAEGLIVSIYSLYCPPCHREAGRLNALYRILKQRRLPLKIIGLAPGNSETEVESYRAKHSVPFPLFKDPDYDMHALTGRLPVPSFYVVDIRGKTPRVALSKIGEVMDEEEFLSRALKALGISAPEK
jgi:peroxiredoxin